ncbi:MAG: hypothetical protein KBC15_01880 [Candidatus Levybacteria bacterium]|nr:hypothetical protein [Candidatus Levybacteria bacterium]
MESLIYAKELVKKNSLRIALGASLVANAAIGADAGLRSGEGVKDVGRTLYDAGKDIVHDFANPPCEEEVYYEEHKEACDRPYPVIKW